MVNLHLKAALVKRFGSQVEAANRIGIRENRLSYLIRGHVLPTEQERRALEQALGKNTAKRLLKNHAR